MQLPASEKELRFAVFYVRIWFHLRDKRLVNCCELVSIVNTCWGTIW